MKMKEGRKGIEMKEGIEMKKGRRKEVNTPFRPSFHSLPSFLSPR
jgi:hypothetical protein